MAETHEDRITTTHTMAAFYVAAEVGEKLRLSTPTVYEMARRNPDRLGAVYFGRAVRFRRPSVQRLLFVPA